MLRNFFTTLPSLIMIVILWIPFIWIISLIVRALRKYLRSGPAAQPSEQAKSLGEALKARRTAANYTQEYVAEALGISRQAVSKWENGTSEPSTANLMALAKLYGVSVDELLTG